METGGEGRQPAEPTGGQPAAGRGNNRKRGTWTEGAEQEEEGPDQQRDPGAAEFIAAEEEQPGEAELPGNTGAHQHLHQEGHLLQQHTWVDAFVWFWRKF